MSWDLDTYILAWNPWTQPTQDEKAKMYFLAAGTARFLSSSGSSDGPTCVIVVKREKIGVWDEVTPTPGIKS